MHRLKWFWVDFLNGAFAAIIILFYHVPWYVAVPGVVGLAIFNYIDGKSKD
jgi:hypothetical protein